MKVREAKPPEEAHTTKTEKTHTEKKGLKELNSTKRPPELSTMSMATFKDIMSR